MYTKEFGWFVYFLSLINRNEMKWRCSIFLFFILNSGHLIMVHYKVSSLLTLLTGVDKIISPFRKCFKAFASLHILFFISIWSSKTKFWEIHTFWEFQNSKLVTSKELLYANKYQLSSTLSVFKSSQILCSLYPSCTQIYLEIHSKEG